MNDINTALEAIKTNLPHRQHFMHYYDGNHNLAFATEKFKSAFGLTLKNMRDNLCPIVVDAVADRMEVINFAGEDEEKQSAVADVAWALWQREQMELISNETHVEALKTGCAYQIVWPDDDGIARFYLQDSRNCTVIEDEDTGKALFAAKQWLTKDDFIRLTLFYPDHTEKYITIKKREATGELKDQHFKAFDADVENPYGVIPMFKFECNPVLSDAIPIQDALNKTLGDSLVAAEFMAFPQRWATGLEPPTDELTGVQKTIFNAGADRLWFVNDKDVKFGQFDPANLESYTKVADSYRLEMARVSGTPLHFFSINTSDAISGEALKTLESRFTKKVKRLCLNFGAVWAAAMRLALVIEKSDVSESLTTQWDSPEQRSEKEFLETLLLKADLGVPSEVLFEEYGYTKEDIARFSEIEPEVEVDPAVNDAKRMANGG